MPPSLNSVQNRISSAPVPPISPPKILRIMNPPMDDVNGGGLRIQYPIAWPSEQMTTKSSDCH